MFGDRGRLPPDEERAYREHLKEVEKIKREEAEAWRRVQDEAARKPSLPLVRDRSRRKGLG